MDGARNDVKQGSSRCGRKKRDGNCCLNEAGKGTDHLGVGPCWLHGGRLPNVRKSAQHQIAREAVERLGLRREVDSHRALLEEVWRAAGWVDWLERQIRQHDPDALATGELPEDVRARYWLGRYDRERVRLVDASAAAIRAGVAERQVKIAEEQGRLIAEVIRGVLDDLGVSDRPDVGKLVRRHLELVDDDDTQPN